MHPAMLEPDALLAECTVRRGRAGGPGGQNRNKVETHITLLHGATGMEAQAGERRSQIENQRMALRRLRLTLAVEYRTEPVRLRGRAALAALDVAEGSALWRERARGGRISCNTEHEDFPAILAEAMDYLADCGWEPGDAGRRLGVTASQLVKLLKDHPPAMVKCNGEREGRGMRRLK